MNEQLNKREVPSCIDAGALLTVTKRLWSSTGT